MRSLLASLLLLFMTAWPAFATEYWSGYDSSGNKVEIIVRYSGKLQNGTDIFFRDVAKSTQAEGTVVSVEYSGTDHARVEVYVNGQSRVCDVSR
ncbi:MAG: hypothetical protein IJU65_03015 [Desulfovibrio sp.]|nr:hypothetical protein [Desulfovibrio sp.]